MRLYMIPPHSKLEDVLAYLNMLLLPCVMRVGPSTTQPVLVFKYVWYCSVTYNALAREETRIRKEIRLDQLERLDLGQLEIGLDIKGGVVPRKRKDSRKNKQSNFPQIL